MNKIFSIKIKQDKKHLLITILGIKFTLKFNILLFYRFLTTYFEKIIYKKRLNRPLLTEDFLKNNEFKTFFPTSKEDLKGRHYILKDLAKKSLVGINEITSSDLTKQDIDLVIAMGYNHLRNNIFEMSTIFPSVL